MPGRWRWRARTLPRSVSPAASSSSTAPSPRRRGRFDLALANLPYVADGDRPTLPADVADWEPEAALFAGPDGLAVIRAVLAALGSAAAGPAATPSRSRSGSGRRRTSPPSSAAAGYPDVATRADLAGIDRVVVGRR